MIRKHILLRSFAPIVAATILSLAASLMLATEADAQSSLLRKAIKKVDDQLKRPETKPSPTSPTTERTSAGSTDTGELGEIQGAGRLVFSKQPIDPANPSNLSTSFATGDHIYAALILNKSMRDFVADQYVRDSSKGYSVTRPGFAVDFQLDGSPMFDGNTKFVFQLEQKEGAMEAVPADNFLIFDISPDPANAKTYSYDKMFFPLLTAVGRKNNKAKAGAQFYSFHIGKLSSGEHTVSLTFMGKDTIEGEFTISGSNYAFYKDVADKMDSVAAANATLPKAEWSNAAVTGSVARAYRKVGSESVMRTVLISPSWFIQKNNLGIIIHRGLFAVIATKTAGGECYMQKEYFKQLYRGGGRYGATMQDGRSETRQRIPCENVFK